MGVHSTLADANVTTDSNQTNLTPDGTNLPRPLSSSLPELRTPLTSEGESAKDAVRAGLERPTRVLLMDGRTVQGTLVCYDHLGNMILSRTADLTKRASKRKPAFLGTVLIPAHATQRIFLSRQRSSALPSSLAPSFVPDPPNQPATPPQLSSTSPSGTSGSDLGESCDSQASPNIDHEKVREPDQQCDSELANQTLSSLLLVSSTRPSDTGPSQSS